VSKALVPSTLWYAAEVVAAQGVFTINSNYLTCRKFYLGLQTNESTAGHKPTWQLKTDLPNST
jgi:hypothetical protein